MLPEKSCSPSSELNISLGGDVKKDFDANKEVFEAQLQKLRDFMKTLNLSTENSIFENYSMLRNRFRISDEVLQKIFSEFGIEINFESEKTNQRKEQQKEILLTFEGIDSFEALNKTKQSDLNNFFISTDTTFIGKPQAISQTKVRLNLAHKLEKNGKIEFLFLHNSIDGRELKAYGKKTLSEEFFLYKVISDSREYFVLSKKKLENVEQNFSGMKLQSVSSTEISRRFSLQGYVNLFFVADVKPTIKILNFDELLNITHNFSKEEFLYSLLYHNDDNTIYKQPEDYLTLLACVLFSGKLEGYPLHLITIGATGLGKTKKQETLNFRFNEQRGVFEASNSRLKGLIPSFKEKPASQGYILECNRVALIDELFKMIEASFNDSHTSINSVGNVLQQFNPLLEHKKRTIGSGNDNSLFMNPTAKIITDCNPLSNKYTLPEHLNVLDVSTLSRFIIWIIDGEHYEFIKQEKEHIGNPLSQGVPPKTLKYDDFLSFYDTLNSFTSKIDILKIKKVFKGVNSQIFDERIKPLWEARGIHHTYLIVDGLTKMRCLFDARKTDFIALDEDYEKAQSLLLRLVQNMQKPIARSFH